MLRNKQRIKRLEKMVDKIKKAKENIVLRDELLMEKIGNCTDIRTDLTLKEKEIIIGWIKTLMYQDGKCSETA